MSMEVNGAAILQAIATAPADFALNEGQLNTLAVTTLLARLKDKAMTLAQVRAAREAVGPHDFDLMLDFVATKDLVALAKRLDPKHPELRVRDESWQRQLVRRLAEGLAEPTQAVTRPTRAPRAATPKSDVVKKPPKTGEVMKSKALKARSKARVPKAP